MFTRRHVANDHACLFTCFSHLCEGPTPSSTPAALRKLVADAVLGDPDTFSEAVLQKPPQQYAAWVQDKFSWGGDVEASVLALHYRVTAVVVMMEGGAVLEYGAGGERIHLLYTGQHYDPLVGGPGNAVAEDVLRWTPAAVAAAGGVAATKEALSALAAVENAAAVKKRAQRRVKKLRCGGCGALLDDSEAFQAHCMDETVEHDDDFGYECDEVEVVEEGDAAADDDRLDLASEDVAPFYNTASMPLSMVSVAPFHVDGTTFESLDQFWRWSKAEDAEKGNVMAGTVFDPDERAGWDSMRAGVLAKGTAAKVAQCASVKAALDATGAKTIAFVDPHPWLGVSAPGGIAIGRNELGMAWANCR